MKNLVECIMLTGILLFVVSCTDDDESNPIISETDEVYRYSIPETTDDGWITASVLDVGMAEKPLVDMVNMLDTTENHQIHNILIFKDNKLVFEKYFEALEYNDSPPGNGTELITYDKNMLHFLASESKSVTSILFGIAIKNGFVDGDVNAKILNYFPHYNTILKEDKKNITVKHLLTMTSGLDFDENTYPYGDTRNDVTALFYESDPIKFVLSKNMHAHPGEVFHYNSGITNVLAEIIRLKSEKNLLEFAEIYLFEPLGISNYNWQRIRGEYYFASGGLSLRPRDLAKIGSLIINDGIWNGRQIITTDWINESVRSYVVPDMNLTSGYGYQWWVENTIVDGSPISYCLSAGYGEQYMIIVPALNLIMVFNCGYFDVPVTISPMQLIDDYIVYALFPDI